MPASEDRPSFLPLLVIAAVVWIWGSRPDAPPPPDEPTADLVSETFERYESLFRAAQAAKAAKLRAGELTTEQAGVEWMQAQKLSQQAFAPLLEYEYAEFGGEKWTAEKEAAVAERWATGGAP